MKLIRGKMRNDDPQFRGALITMAPIGVIHTPFQQSEGTPIQSAVANGANGVIELFPEYALGLRDVADFERLWLIYLLDRAASPQLTTRPYLDTQDHGIFATRSPARPNHIGLSSVRLLGVEGNRLHISDVDMLDGTPLLDIKPYVPDFDCFAVNRVGWYAGKSAKDVVADDRFEAKGRGPESPV
jgi:tRNA-Thr(GGU) m(6)t(6)A37 methyltransferase TsaA